MKPSDYYLVVALRKENLELQNKLEKAKDVISWYGNIEQYLAELKDMPTGFDFKHTPVHMDGGKRARTTLEEIM